MSRHGHIPYQQLHPAKLATDWVFWLISLIAFWNHQPILGLILACGPSVLVSYIIDQLGTVSAFAHTALGRYISTHMTGWLQTIRYSGLLLSIIGAWSHDGVIIAFGIALIILSWFYGYFMRALSVRSRITASFLKTRHRIPHNLPR